MTDRMLDTLQMGKGASTSTDEDHQDNVANFTKQQNQATRLAKEATNYMKAMKGELINQVLHCEERSLNMADRR